MRDTLYCRKFHHRKRMINDSNDTMIQITIESRMHRLLVCSKLLIPTHSKISFNCQNIKTLKDYLYVIEDLGRRTY